MGQKYTKPADLFVTEDTTSSSLPEEELSKFSGKPRDYISAEVVLDEPHKNVLTWSDLKTFNLTSSHEDSIINLLTRAHRKGYSLSFVIPANASCEEDGEKKIPSPTSGCKTTHVAFLSRMRIGSAMKKELSLRIMDAQKTFLSVMKEQKYQWLFDIKDFEDDIYSDGFADRLQHMIVNETKQGSRLLCVIPLSDVLQNEGSAEEESSFPIKLRLVFMHWSGDDFLVKFEYRVEEMGVECMEKLLKLNKKSTAPKSKRVKNTSWMPSWTDSFKDGYKVVDVLPLGKKPLVVDPADKKASKKSKGNFTFHSLLVYEKLTMINEEKEQSEEEYLYLHSKYEGMVREIWMPVGSVLRSILEVETEQQGKSGWELCALLSTSHVRMKEDGTDHQKCALFYQRPCKQCLSIEEMADDKEIENEDVDEAVSSRPKVKRPGVSLLAEFDLAKAKLRPAQVNNSKQESDVKQESLDRSLADVKLKKVNRESIKKSTTKSDDDSELKSIKLRQTKTNAGRKPKEATEDVPWISTLERKRKAVIEREESTEKSDSDPTTNLPEKKLHNPNSAESGLKQSISTDDQHETVDSAVDSGDCSGSAPSTCTTETLNRSEAIDQEVEKTIQDPGDQLNVVSKDHDVETEMPSEPSGDLDGDFAEKQSEEVDESSGDHADETGQEEYAQVNELVASSTEDSHKIPHEEEAQSKTNDHHNEIALENVSQVNETVKTTHGQDNELSEKFPVEVEQSSESSKDQAENIDANGIISDKEVQHEKELSQSETSSTAVPSDLSANASDEKNNEEETVTYSGNKLEIVEAGQNSDIEEPQPIPESEFGHTTNDSLISSSPCPQPLLSSEDLLPIENQVIEDVKKDLLKSTETDDSKFEHTNVIDETVTSNLQQEESQNDQKKESNCADAVQESVIDSSPEIFDKNRGSEPSFKDENYEMIEDQAVNALINEILAEVSSELFNLNNSITDEKQIHNDSAARESKMDSEEVLKCPVAPSTEPCPLDQNQIKDEVVSRKRGNCFGDECVWGMDMIGIPSTKHTQKDESTKTTEELVPTNNSVSTEGTKGTIDASLMPSEAVHLAENTQEDKQEKRQEENSPEHNSEDNQLCPEESMLNEPLAENNYSKDVMRYVDDLVQKDDSGVESSGSNQCINEIASNCSSSSEENCIKPSKPSQEYLSELASSEDSSESTLVYCCSNDSSGSKPSSTEEERCIVDVEKNENKDAVITDDEKVPKAAQSDSTTEYLLIEP